MKTRIFSLLILFPFFCLAEPADQPKNSIVPDSVAGTSMLLKNESVIFQKVFSSTLKREELIQQLNTLLASKRNFKLEQSLNENDLIGRLVKYEIDYRKFDLSMFSTATIVANPLSATVVIQVKDFKYRVTVSEITFLDVLPAGKQRPAYSLNVKLDDEITQSKRSKFSSKNGDIKLAQYIDQDFSHVFDLSKSNTATGF
jgi:hypothetical protein